MAASITVQSICSSVRCDMHVSHACHMHEPGTDARIWTCDVWWAPRVGAAHICNIVWCICLSNSVYTLGCGSMWEQVPGGWVPNDVGTGCIPVYMPKYSGVMLHLKRLRYAWVQRGHTTCVSHVWQPWHRTASFSCLSCACLVHCSP